MTFDEFRVKISLNKINYAVLIGPNNSGKTHLLNYIYNSFGNEVMMIDESGLTQNKYKKNKIKIINSKYVYQNESGRGTIDQIGEPLPINNNSKEIIKQLNEIKEKITFSKLSQGMKKINLIIDSFLNYNLNNIDLFLIDEPESFLDDLNFKYLIQLFNVLKENHKKLIITTHNARLLELLKLEISDIYILPKIYHDIINLSFTDVKELFRDTSLSISRSPEIHYENIEKMDKLKLNKPDSLLNIYLRQTLTSLDFYQSLFYTDVIITEGKSEKVIFQKSNSNYIFLQSFIFSYGKLYIPFLINLYRILGKNVKVLIDNDENHRNTFYKSLSVYISNSLMDNRNIYIFQDDLEDFLEINNNIILELINDFDSSNNFINKFENNHYFKPFISEHAISRDTNLDQKISDLLKDIIES